jgi:hypothetical protein
VGDQMNYAHLDVLWWGVCVGGKHYTGKVIWHRDAPHESVYHELRRRLSLREAKELGETQERLWVHRVERDTNKFDNQGQIDRAALRWCKEHMPEPWALFEHDEHNPHRLIGTSAAWLLERQKVINDFAETWRKTSDRVREEKTVWDKSYALWRKLLTPPA